MPSARIPASWPSAVTSADPLAVLTKQHEALRSAVESLPLAVDDDGRGDPTEGRLLRAILERALRWHLDDEETVLLPRLSGLGPGFEQMTECCRAFHEGIKSAAPEVTDLARSICRGGTNDPAEWREACEALRLALEPALIFEDEALLPAARRVFARDDREDIAAMLRARAEARPELSELVCPPERPRRVSTVTIMRPDGAPALVRRYADCPRNRTISTELCASCPHGVAEGDHALWCELDETPVPLCVADVMTRAVRCVAPEVGLEELVVLLDDAGVSGAPVVDELGRVLGVVSQTDVVRTLATTGTLGRIRVSDAMMRVPFCIDERASIDNAAALLAYEGVHRLPVVNAQHEVVGIVSALDLVRWRSGRADEADASHA